MRRRWSTWEQGEEKGAGGVGGSWKVAEHVEAVTFALEEILASHTGGLGVVSVCSVFRRVVVVCWPCRGGGGDRKINFFKFILSVLGRYPPYKYM